MSAGHSTIPGKLKSVVTSPSGISLAKGAGCTMNKMNVMGSRTPSYIRGSMFPEAFEKAQLRRQTIRFDSNSVGYGKLRVTSNIQYFREDWGGVTALRYFQNGDKIAVGFNSGDLHIYKVVGSPAKVAHFGTVLKGWEGNHSISCIRFHPKSPNCMYAASTEGTIIFRDLGGTDDFNNYIITEDDNEIYTLDFTADSKLVTAGKDATPRLYDLNTNKLVRELGGKESLQPDDPTLEGFHEKRVYCVRCHPEDPAVFVSGGWDGRVKVWDVRMRKPNVRGITGPFIFGESIDLCKGKLLTASCVANNSLQLWDLGSGFLIKNVDPANKRVYLYGEYPYAAQFFKGDPSGDLVLFGVGGLQIISVNESSILYICEDDKPVTAIDSVDRRFSFGGKSNSATTGDISMLNSSVSLHSSTLLSVVSAEQTPSLQKSDTISINK